MFFIVLHKAYSRLQDTGVSSVNFPVCPKKECIKEYQVGNQGVSTDSHLHEAQETPCGSIIALIKSQPIVADYLISILYIAATTNTARGYNRNGLGLTPGQPGLYFMCEIISDISLKIRFKFSFSFLLSMKS